MTDDLTTATPAASSGTTTLTAPAEPAGVLVIEDDPAVRAILVRFLTSRGYRAESVSSGPAALTMLRQSRFALALCDVQMPDMSGLEVVREALRIDPQLAIVMLTGASDAATATEALSSGAFDYLMKPIRWTALKQAIERSLHRRRLLGEQRRIDALIREEVALQTAQLRGLAVNVVETLVNAMEAKDIYLRGHSQRTAELAASMADELGLDTEAIEHVRVAGRLHDVGKIGVREAVLHKPGSLTPAEFEEVKAHVRVGMQILSPMTHLGPVLDFVRDHHEHWDGSGYPCGLTGTAISMGGRILAAADAFDSLTSRRAYRQPVSGETAIAQLEAHAGTLLDPAVYEALRKVVGRRQSLTFIDDVHG